MALADLLRGVPLLSAASRGPDEDYNLFPHTPSTAVYIYVSATASDSVEERDIIQLRVLPPLRALARTYGFVIDFVDMRWGYPLMPPPPDGRIVDSGSSSNNGEGEAAAAVPDTDDGRDTDDVGPPSVDDDAAWRVHKRELLRCFRASSGGHGLWFLSLLGDKYGATVLPRALPPACLLRRLETYAALLRQLSSGEAGPGSELEAAKGRQLVMDWYRLDKVAAPPVYRLKSLPPAAGGDSQAVAARRASSSNLGVSGKAGTAVSGKAGAGVSGKGVVEVDDPEARFLRDTAPLLLEVLRDGAIEEEDKEGDGEFSAVGDVSGPGPAAALLALEDGGHGCVVGRSVVEWETATALRLAAAQRQGSGARAASVSGSSSMSSSGSALLMTSGGAPPPIRWMRRTFDNVVRKGTPTTQQPPSSSLHALLMIPPSPLLHTSRHGQIKRITRRCSTRPRAPPPRLPSCSACTPSSPRTSRAGATHPHGPRRAPSLSLISAPTPHHYISVHCQRVAPIRRLLRRASC